MVIFRASKICFESALQSLSKISLPVAKKARENSARVCHSVCQLQLQAHWKPQQCKEIGHRAPDSLLQDPEDRAPLGIGVKSSLHRHIGVFCNR